MACPACKSSKQLQYDRHGNPVKDTPIVEGKAALEQQEIEAHKHKEMVDEIMSMSYSDYVGKKKEFREAGKQMGKERIREFSEDYKRIQIDELISVYNHEDIHIRLSPTQALIALWELSRLQEYQRVFSEFEGLMEVVNRKYEELNRNKISLKWKP